MRDIASPESEAEAADVRRVLEELGAGEDAGQRMLEVWNKIDLLPTDAREFLAARAARSEAGAVAVSAATGEGIERLTERLAALVDEGPLLTLALDAADGEALAWLYRHGRVVSREPDEEAGVIVTAKLDPAALARVRTPAPAGSDGAGGGVGAPSVEGAGDLVAGAFLGAFQAHIGRRRADCR